jgi:hypothetical protein
MINLNAFPPFIDHFGLAGFHDKLDILSLLMRLSLMIPTQNLKCIIVILFNVNGIAIIIYILQRRRKVVFRQWLTWLQLIPIFILAVITGSWVKTSSLFAVL